MGLKSCFQTDWGSMLPLLLYTCATVSVSLGHFTRHDTSSSNSSNSRTGGNPQILKPHPGEDGYIPATSAAPAYVVPIMPTFCATFQENSEPYYVPLTVDGHVFRKVSHPAPWHCKISTHLGSWRRISEVGVELKTASFFFYKTGCSWTRGAQT